MWFYEKLGCCVFLLWRNFMVSVLIYTKNYVTMRKRIFFMNSMLRIIILFDYRIILWFNDYNFRIKFKVLMQKWVKEKPKSFSIEILLDFLPKFALWTNFQEICRNADLTLPPHYLPHYVFYTRPLSENSFLSFEQKKLV